MEEKNKNSKVIIVISVLCICVLILGVCLKSNVFVGKKSETKSTKETKKDKNKKDNINELDINSDEVKNLFDPFKYHTSIAGDEELYRSDKVVAKDLSTNYKNRLAFAKYLSSSEYASSGANLTGYSSNCSLSSDTLDKYFKQLFGAEESYVAQTFNSYGIGHIEMKYNQTDNTYYCDPNSGDATTNFYASQIDKAEQTKRYINIYINVVVYNQTGANYSAYMSLEDSNAHNNPIKESTNYSDIIKYVDESKSLHDLSQYKEKASKYKMVFENKNGNYIFNYIEKIND